jgi:nucleoside-triphosphatase THEP1
MLLGRRGCTPGTRVDVINRIMDWASDPLESSPRIFWIEGPAGTGKSTLAYTISDRLQRRQKLGASFFCSRQEEDARQERYIIPTIVKALSSVSSSFARALVSVPEFASEGVETQMKEMLVDRWRDSISDRPAPFWPLIVVVDALDENEGGTNFLQKLVEAVNAEPQGGCFFQDSSFW